MRLNSYYEEHVKKYLQYIDMRFLQNKTVLITGVTGMVGSALADVLCLADQNIRVIGMGRSKERALKRFNYPWYSKDNFFFFEQDVAKTVNLEEHVDYIIHAASPAYPAVFAKFPVETMTANFLGTLNLLELAKNNNAKFLFVSSGEIYGEIAKDIKDESSYGFIESMHPRSCYPNSKRAAETLCASFLEEYDVETVVVRLSHVYGPTMTNSDNRVSTEFIRTAKNGKDLVMHSTGSTVRSYTYVLDVVSGIICVLKNGNCGEAYNIADENKVVSVRQLAEVTAKVAGVNFKVELLNENDKGTTSITRQVMSGEKTRILGWHCMYDFEGGVVETLKSMV